MTHQHHLSLDAGRIAHIVNGRAFAIIGGRSNENFEDLARGKLLFEAHCLQKFQGTRVKYVPFVREHPMPSNWKGVLIDCERAENKDPAFTNWGEECIFCSYWGPSLENDLLISAVCLIRF